MNNNEILQEMRYNSQKKDPSTVWLLFLLLGWSYGSFDSMGKQILYYLTFGGFGLWWLYVLFTLNGKINKHNQQLRNQLNLK